MNRNQTGMKTNTALDAPAVRAKTAGRRKRITAEEKKRIFGCVNAVFEKKAEDVVVLDLRGLSGVADFFVICHGGSQRQVQAISEEVELALRNQGVKDYNVEGRETCSWVLLDFHDVVVHVFHSAARAYYALENLWSDARRLDTGEILAWGAH